MPQVIHLENALHRRQRQTIEVQSIIGSSPAMQQLWTLIRKLAPRDIIVLIQGESGTGKELVARALHDHSQRREGPFVTLNCSALQETILESELFGHQRGSFTGAVTSTQGLFEVANKGTLFLDEVGDLAPSIQAKLLRALQFGEVRPVGSTRTLRVNVRIIAASNKDLAAQVQAGQFREDLFYRLNVVTVEAPALRQRPTDIPELIEYFLKRFRDPNSAPIRLDPEVHDMLKKYHWPGNVRELENIIEHLVILADNSHITLRDLPNSLRYGARNGDAPDTVSLPLEEIERRHILRVLEHHRGNKTQAAKTLKIGLKTLYNKLKMYEVGS